jgi:hypothetical protein
MLERRRQIRCRRHRSRVRRRPVSGTGVQNCPAIRVGSWAWLMW